jgi:hypothetical protein
MSVNFIDEAITTFSELKRMHQLNSELLEQLTVTFELIFQNNIPLPNSGTVYSLISKARALLAEIQSSSEVKILQYKKLSDESKHLNKPNGEVPVPAWTINKGV